MAKTITKAQTMLQLLESLIAGSTLLLSFLIFTNPKGVNKQANFWLGIFMFSLALVNLDTLLITHKIYHTFPHLIGISDLLFFLVPPSIYFAALYFVAPQRKYRWTDLFHFFFFITYCLLNLPALVMQDGPSKLKMLLTEEPMQADDYIASGIILVYTLTYCILSLLKINRHQKNVAQIHSSSEGIDLSWFKYFLICVLILAGVWATYVLVQSDLLNYVVTTTYFVLVFFLAYYALHQREVYNFNANEKEAIQQLTEGKQELPKKPQLEPAQLQGLKQQLDALMQSEKPFLDNELNLLKLAARMQITIHTLSYVINEGYGENFAQYVNRYRVEEAKKLLDDPRVAHLSILGIAFDAGFNSKTVFNTTFKKVTGLSPSEYKSRSSVL